MLPLNLVSIPEGPIKAYLSVYGFVERFGFQFPKDQLKLLEGTPSITPHIVSIPEGPIKATKTTATRPVLPKFQFPKDQLKRALRRPVARLSGSFNSRRTN